MIWISPVMKVYIWGWWGDMKLQQARAPSQAGNSIMCCYSLCFWFLLENFVLETALTKLTASSNGINFTLWTDFKLNYVAYLHHSVPPITSTLTTTPENLTGEVNVLKKLKRSRFSFWGSMVILTGKTPFCSSRQARTLCGVHTQSSSRNNLAHMGKTPGNSSLNTLLYLCYIKSSDDGK